MTRLVIAALFILLGRFQSTGADHEDAALSSRPNILLMMADDLGWDDVCANQALNGRPRCNIYTPALDALAASGMRLMRHYTEPWCLPSRSSLLTGIAPARLGVNFVNMEADETRLLFGLGPSSFQRGDERRGHGEDATGSSAARGYGGVTGAGAQYVGLATHLRAAGYTTAWVGKWHSVGLPHSMGFQHRFGSLFGQLKDYYKPSLVRYPPLAGPGSMNGTREVVQGYATQREAEEAVAIIQSWDWSTEHPFFLYLAWHAPHSPHQRTEEAKRYERFYSRERSSRMGQITALDRGVGAVMRALKRKNLIESTLVVFISDNGAPGPAHKKTSSSSSLRALSEGNDFSNDHLKRPYPSNYPLLGYKGSLYEGGIRTFAVASWPRVISPNSFSRAPMHISDWLPTFLHLALPPTVASDVTTHLDGKPVWQILIGACDRAYDPSSSVASYEEDGRIGRATNSPDLKNHAKNENTSSRSSRSRGVYGLGCRGTPISISSHLPMFGNGRHKLDLARKQDWARIGSATAASTLPTVHGTNAALITSNSLPPIYREKPRSGSQGPQLLPPMHYFARGAHFSLDGSCKVFLDPDASSDSHGANVHTGRPAPSHCITGSNQPVEAVEFKRVELVEPELSLAQSAVAPSPFAVPLEVLWSSYGGNERHCAWDSMQQEWQELVQTQEPDYGGRLACAPAWNKTSNTKPVCPLH